MKTSILPFLVFILSCGLLFLPTQALNIHRYKFVVQDTTYTRLCETKKILTVNGQFPGPTLKLRQGDIAYVEVHNVANESVTIHWHGVKQPRYPWSDGPEFITQCPIKPGGKFTQKIVLSDEIGTLWWHAHSDWSRATVHGFINVYPKIGDRYPFRTPDGEFSLLLGEWWKTDISEVLSEFIRRGGDPINSDAFLINGQPGYLYNCSESDTFKQVVNYGKTYLVRMVNAAMNNILFFGIRNHNVTVVGSDGAYTKPLNTDYIAISPGQTIDFLLKTNQKPGHYSIAARAYNRPGPGSFDNTTTTAILAYRGRYIPSPRPILPVLPAVESISASVAFTKSLRSLASAEHPIDVPKGNMTRIFFTVSINTLPCADCDEGPRPGTRFSGSLSNISFQNPKIDILQAYYYGNKSVYGVDFPDNPPLEFNYTAQNLSRELQTPSLGTEVKVLEYNTEVELVFQSTNLVSGIDHPMHLHGYSFYVVGTDLGNYNSSEAANYNLVDPPLQNTIAVPVNGWSAVRFKANNPGVWYMHCHFERHVSWGMGMTFIVKDGKRRGQNMLPSEVDLPPC